MKNIKQSQVFLDSEADEWFKRNEKAVMQKNFSSDLVVKEVSKIILMSSPHHKLSILEVGAGHGKRLEYLSKTDGVGRVDGVEPSLQAIELAKNKGITLVRGTAEHLPFESGIFDVLIFGFCLYLCDRKDLFKIASEADRVLKNNGWIIINDFYAPLLVQRPYSHKDGISTFKMDYRKLFEWHPDYTCYSHHVTNHDHPEIYTDDSQEWMAVSVLRKKTSLQYE